MTSEHETVDVCICSYRRPEIVETLRALARQSGLGSRRYRVIVADNTAEAAARALVLEVGREFGLDLHYVHAPANNISVARNACLDAARGTWIAFIDDDEMPTRNWLALLLAEAERGQWRAVVGPVVAIYPADAARWLRSGDFHSTGPVWSSGQMLTAYTGNILFHRDIVEKHALRFRLELGTSGGEDEDFFDRFHQTGERIGFASAAVCYECVPSDRARLAWLLRRRFRAGQSHGARLGRCARHPLYPLYMGLALAKAAYCGARATISAPCALPRNRHLVRAALHCGVAARLAGLAEIRMY